MSVSPSLSSTCWELCFTKSHREDQSTSTISTGSAATTSLTFTPAVGTNVSLTKPKSNSTLAKPGNSKLRQTNSSNMSAEIFQIHITAQKASLKVTNMARSTTIELIRESLPGINGITHFLWPLSLYWPQS